MSTIRGNKEYIVDFPVRLATNTNGFNFINNIYREISENNNLVDKEQAVILKEIFDVFSEDKSCALLPRKIGNRNIAGEEQLLLRDLKELGLHEYGKVRTIISELIANLKMHTIYLDGYFAGYHDYKNHQMIFSIVNYDITLANHIKQIQKMEFEDDYAAIIWALKKNNTTRQMSESGGIGLYLLRKYISIIQGKFSILSGNSYVECDRMCYNEESENAIRVKRTNVLPQRFEGTVITLYIPDNKSDIVDEKRILEEICLKWLSEG